LNTVDTQHIGVKAKAIPSIKRSQRPGRILNPRPDNKVNSCRIDGSAGNGPKLALDQKHSIAQISELYTKKTQTRDENKFLTSNSFFLVGKENNTSQCLIPKLSKSKIKFASPPKPLSRLSAGPDRQTLSASKSSQFSRNIPRECQESQLAYSDNKERDNKCLTRAKRDSAVYIGSDS